MKIVIVGGCGHVGLPLALSLSEKGHTVVALDIDPRVVETVNSGKAPFLETGLEPLLKSELSNGNFLATLNPSCISDANIIVVVIGTPVDGNGNPSKLAVVNAVQGFSKFLNNSQEIVLRSTVTPGVTQLVIDFLRSADLRCEVYFCPERIAEGFALKELQTLPQIIGSTNSKRDSLTNEMFKSLGIETISSTILEAELAKLLTNAYRYIKFAVANEFWEIANFSGVDYDKVHRLITQNYPRASDLPRAGYAAGPCLVKDTVQLSNHFQNRFSLGNTALNINEGLPLYVVNKMEQKYRLKEFTVGILGMAFKGESDDTRSSLSYKLVKSLEGKCSEVLTSDPYVQNDTNLVSVEEIVKKSDILVIAAPHKVYREISFKGPIIDIWNLLGNGNLL